MEDLLEKLERERAQLLLAVLEVEDIDRMRTRKRIQSLKDVYEELELVAAAAAPVVHPSEGASNPNPAVLTADFYASYLVVLLLAKNLNDARFLWKRIALETKQESEPLRNVWEIGKALWERDFTAAYAAMSKTWPETLGPVIAVLRQSTRESTAELLSSAYSSISFNDAAHALGFDDEPSLLQYCQALGWSVSSADHMIHPKPLPQTTTRAAALEQLDTISQYVLHLEQNTLVKLQ
ncbi:hypothetical protein Poli38472_001328 [Pythium oligandrum]|uniref:COP9 signalosome complex subunit 8 n=1 Tax=Pythium oligandrum TaxID=41045 RepID=A0A8K1CSP3_PYTOL|nr:hypothetical protein Poli38472_001328 [Pythium oligandrum]|eukprot:TMW69172.1 hypothetical protein Poli38472_001328 [Pythium oligandrum]